MTMRKIITIDADACNGCRLCVDACHEGAIGMKDGKAVLLRDDYCDGLGDCLPVCPTGAISFEEREALAYDDAAVKLNMAKNKAKEEPLGCGCPGSMAKSLVQSDAPAATQNSAEIPSALAQWPVQLQLVPVNAPYWDNADILLAADCAAYASGNFHSKFMQRRVTVIACPKLDDANYTQKLAEILSSNNVRSLTVVRMEVPCCGGLASFAKQAVQDSGKNIPLQTIVLSLQGEILA